MTFFVNFLTMLRIIFIPFIIWGFFADDHASGAWVVLVLFLIASVTDFFDGYLARKFNATSKFGAMIDPIADKLLVAVVLVMLVYDRIGGQPRADLIPVIIIICRELLVSGLREFLAAENVKMPVTKLAKWKTTFQFIALVFLLSAPLVESVVVKGVAISPQIIGQIFLWVAAVLTFITGYKYFVHTIKVIFHDTKIFHIRIMKDEEMNNER